MQIDVPAPFTLSELQAALERGSQAADLTGFARSETWAAQLGCTIAKMRLLIRQGIERGICESRQVRLSEIGARAINGYDAVTTVYAWRVQPQPRSLEEGTEKRGD